MKYRIFETIFGDCAFVFDKNGIFRFYLPYKREETLLNIIKEEFLDLPESADYNGSVIFAVQNYFKGKKVKFKEKLNLDGYTEFERKVLNEALKIPYGETVTYKELAVRSNSPLAVRAVGSVMGKNKIPLIIPCHRVICSSGELGGFSAEGGVEFKRKLLLLEQSGLKC